MASRITRREFVQQGITVGFALAVCPIAGCAVKTPADGLVTEEITVPSKGAPLPAFVARPRGEGPFPVVLVIHEIFGVHAYIQDVARRLANEGYYAIAPALFFREGDVTKLKEIGDLLKIVGKVPQAQVLSDLDACLDWAKAKKEADPNRLAITGFCWGGNVTWMYAAHNPRLRAGAAWYGRLVRPD